MAVYLNNQFVDKEDAVLHVSDLAMQRGYAVFDYFRAVNGVPLFMDDHLDRILASAAAMHLKIKKSKAALAEIIEELIKRSDLPMAGIRMMITGGYSPDFYNPVDANLVISCNPLKLPTEGEFNNGLSIITHDFQRDLPHIKSINYQHAIWLQPQLREKNADDVLYFRNNIVTEFPRCNLFMVTAAGKLVTPVNNMLLGITRKYVLKMVAGTIPIEERDIQLEELFTAKELFLTSSTKRILPVVKVDDKKIADGLKGEVTEMIYRQFMELEKTTTQLVSL